MGGQHVLVDGVILGHQDVQAQRRNAVLRRAGGRRRRRGFAEWNLHPKRAAHSWFRVQPDGALQQRGEVLADRQAESGAPVPPSGGAIGLGKRLENPLRHGGFHAAAGVDHFKAEVAIVASAHYGRHPYADAPASGELHGVADEVAENLAEPHGIALDGFGNVAVHFTGQHDAVRGGPGVE